MTSNRATRRNRREKARTLIQREWFGSLLRLAVPTDEAGNWRLVTRWGDFLWWPGSNAWSAPGGSHPVHHGNPDHLKAFLQRLRDGPQEPVRPAPQGHRGYTPPEDDFDVIDVNDTD